MPQPATTASAYSLVEEDPRWLGVADDLRSLIADRLVVEVGCVNAEGCVSGSPLAGELGAVPRTPGAEP